ncbi:MAG: ABC transporter permease [Lachnospiraceae bacterium]|nr:ABC transporter permease [Lachnospiraceae bacterium]
MWKDYLSGYLKYNRSSGLSIRIAALISALLLSLLCSLFYNLWKYELERIQLEEGGWQSRITGELDAEDLETIRNFPNVKEVVINEGETSADLYFYHVKTVLEDTARIAGRLELPSDAVTYHHELLALYLVRDPEDPAPRLLFPMFLLIMGLASVSLIMVIHNSFAVSMHARIHQFGIFSSIGATPRQIRICLLQEAAVLCALPMAAGNLLGILSSMGELHLSNVLLGNDFPGRHPAVFGYHPLVFGMTLLVTIATVWISAWLPARALSRLTPLEAIKNTGELQLKRKRTSPVLTFFFGVEGELAGNALKAQRKALRTASLSLLSSFLAFTVMQSFFVLSEISTRETYFERHQEAWDLMVTVKDAGIDSFSETEEVQNLSGVRSAVVYQKASAKCLVTEEEMSEELKALGGFSPASEEEAMETGSGWLVSAPLIIMDDESFLAYCRQIGIAPRLTGAVLRNRISDVTDPDFRHRRDLPYVKGTASVSVLRPCGGEGQDTEVPVLGYTEEVPALREEYATLDRYELVHFLPVSLWKEIESQIGGAKEDLYIRILGAEDIAPEELEDLQRRVDEIVAENRTAESENRIREREINDRQIHGMKVIFGGFCVLLAVIGIGNVFSNTLGFVRQRKREFARYLSVGLTPEGIRKMFCIEALVLAGRPALITLPLAVLSVGYMLKLSYLDAGEFLAEAPLLPIAAFWLMILGSVALAYVLGWRTVRKLSLTELLWDDTVM